MTEKKRTRDWDKKRVEKCTQSVKEKTARIHANDRARAEKRQGRKPKYTSSKAFAYKLSEYMLKCDRTIIDTEKNKTEPYTLTGLSLAVGLNGSPLQSYIKGEKNYIVDEHTEYRNGHYIETNISDSEKIYLYECDQVPELKPYMDMLYDDTDINAICFNSIYERARLLVQQQAEQRLYINGRVADIFTMKSKHGWTDEVRTVHRLEIATDEQAKKALEDLRLLDD